MRLTDASVAIRPRTPWEAMDLGILLARQHRKLLMTSWLLVTLPLYALLGALLWDSPSWAVFVLWWLKPAYERLPLYILSRALFGDTPTLKQALRALPGLLRPQLLASLTWRRLSPTRSFDLPVLQLEGLKGKARSQRLQLLAQREAGAATWLTLVGVHLETALWIGLTSLIYLLLPSQLSEQWDWQSLISADTSEWLWLEHLSNLFYVLLLAFWGPIYVSCGFSLYLNRRTALEGWDIELAFRRLRQRISGVAYVLLLLASALLLPVPTPAYAQAAAANAEEPGPAVPRLLEQPLNSQASRDSAKQILDSPPFENRETVTRWRLAGSDETDKDKHDDLAERLAKLLQMADGWRGLKALTVFFEALLWALLIGAIALLIWRYRQWLAMFAGRLGNRQDRLTVAAPAQLFGLEVAPQSLPDDIAAAVERLWLQDPRAALSLLYRALLSRLLHVHQLPLKGAHTEGEVLALVQRLDDPQLGNFTHTLTQHWQNLAYGHRPPADELCPQLCNDWRRLLNQEPQA